MAVDYGDARTGVAISDSTGTLAGEAFTIHEGNTQELVRKLADLAQSRGVGRIVVGYPKNMNATVGERAQKSERLAGMLGAEAGLEVVLWDERRSTADAHRILSELNRRGKKRKDTVDAVAATLILEGYLGFIR
jgi:putative Holliday junction resolvase